MNLTDYISEAISRGRHTERYPDIQHGYLSEVASVLDDNGYDKVNMFSVRKKCYKISRASDQTWLYLNNPKLDYFINIIYGFNCDTNKTWCDSEPPKMIVVIDRNKSTCVDMDMAIDELNEYIYTK